MSDKQWWEPLIEDDGKLDWLCDHEGDYSEKINELWAQFTALRKDAERLDWLEAWHDCSDMTGYRYKGMGIELVTRGSDGWHFEWDFKPENSTDYDTLREIIDAAKEEGK